jgi:hypothetical protein
MSDSSWVLDEFSGVNFGDKRLNNRFYKLTSNFAKNPQAQIHQVSMDWFDAKGTYRFFENERVNCNDILQPHYKKTALRVSQYPFFLAIQDTTVVPLFHPDVLFMNQQMIKTTWVDMQKVIAQLNETDSL